MDYKAFADLVGEEGYQRLQNNTSAFRRGDTIAVKLHRTDILTFHSDGKIVLDNDGWTSVTTRKRMNDYLPAPYRVLLAKGEWVVTLGKGRSVPFVQGMVIDTANPEDPVSITAPPPPVDANDVNALHREVEDFVRSITPEQVAAAYDTFAGDCELCKAGTPGIHVRMHVRARELSWSMLVNSIKARNFPDPGDVLVETLERAREGEFYYATLPTLRRYLRVAVLAS